MAAHRYWRLLFSLSNDATYLEVGEAAFRATSGGTNQASGGTPSASTEYSGSYTAAKAFDSSTSTNWSTTAGTTVGSWLKYDFGSAVTVLQIAITTPTSGPSTAPKTWDVQYSDDNSSWTTAWSVTNQTGWRTAQTRVFTDPAAAPGGGAHYHWRLLFTAIGSTSGYYEFAEVEMRSTAGGSDRTGSGLGFAVSSTDFDATLVAANAFDNNTATSWCTATSFQSGAWLQYVFNTAPAIAAVTLRADTSPQYAPGGFDIQYSDDGVSWTTAWSVTGQTGWTSGQTRTFTNGTARRRTAQFFPS